MSDCKFHNICGLPANGDVEAQLCVLHSHIPDKDTQAFDETLKRHREKKRDNFRSMVFPKETNFVGARFTKHANFGMVTFTGVADFGRATFTEQANFMGASFTEHANFSRATFVKEANFGVTKFTKEARFGRATFVKETNFVGTRFTGVADFGGATFTGTTDFTGATFLSRIILNHARFSPERVLSFRDSRFQGRIIFTAGQEASQEETPDEGRTIAVFTNAQQVDFRIAVIDPAATLTFNQTDLTRCRLLGTDLRKVQLVGVKWPMQGSRVVVYDEIVPLEEGETRPWNQIERLYNQLKQNYEDQRDYRRAGDFHYGEKEIQRRNPQTPQGARFLLQLYWLISGYGERIGRPLLWAGGLFGACTLGYLLCEPPPSQGPVPGSLSTRRAVLARGGTV